MRREERYLVLRIKDISRYLNAKERLLLNELVVLIRTYRKSEQRPDLRCVVVESDWPMYEHTWSMIEQWVEPTELSDIYQQAQWELDIEEFEKAVEKEKDRIRNNPRHWFPWRINLINLNRG